MSPQNEWFALRAGCLGYRLTAASQEEAQRGGRAGGHVMASAAVGLSGRGFRSATGVIDTSSVVTLAEQEGQCDR